MATFPADERHLVLVAAVELDASAAESANVRLATGLEVTDVSRHPSRANALLARVELEPDAPLTVDRAEITDLRTAAGDTLDTVVGPEFVHGVREPMELKLANLDGRSPFGSKLVDKHVTISCCTGCNGGIHDRGLVVLNNHIGGPWSSMWVQTNQPLEAPYPRWQKVRMAGGVLEERSGSTVVVDRGWMEIAKLDEPEHHAPPALRITTADLPEDTSRLLIHKSLEGAYVEFRKVEVISAERVEPDKADEEGTLRLSRVEVSFSDPSGGRTAAWLYQGAMDAMSDHRRLAGLRGFVHAEEPGRYVVLSDKEEDVITE
ncbi:MAG: hypothetical protein M3340_13395 [Actinomycetota bacterium]|nr:hypothetical protein [Actinomycetota bacterium]